MAYYWFRMTIPSGQINFPKICSVHLNFKLAPVYDSYDIILGARKITILTPILANPQKQGMVKAGEQVALVQSGRQPIWRFQSTHNIQVRTV